MWGLDSVSVQMFEISTPQVGFVNVHCPIIPNLSILYNFHDLIPFIEIIKKN